MTETMNQPLGILLALLVAVAGVIVAGILHSDGLNHYLSRKIGHLGGGVSYFLLVLWVDRWPAVALAAAAAGVMLLLRFWQPGWLRGVGGTGRPHAYAEVTYALAGAASLAIGWGLFNDRWLAFLPIGFMAFGDSITGALRSWIYKREVKGWWGSAGMLAVCLVVALLYHPYWVGATGAVVATLAERFSPLATGWWDDNWLLVASSLAVMISLKGVTGS